MSIGDQLRAFPPSFEGNPFTYGFALFSLTLITSLSLAQIFHYLFEFRVRRAANAITPLDDVANPPIGSTVMIHRMIVSGFLMTVLFGACPDVLILLFWGEASRPTMELLYAIDRVGDGLTLFPFLCSMFLIAWAYQALPQALMMSSHIPLARPAFHMIVDKLKIALAVLLIAVGVTAGKAYA